MAWLDNGRNRAFYAVGGTWRAIARLHMERTDYPLHVMHGYMMPTEEAIDFCEQIRKAKKLSAMPGIEEISRPRREVLPYGALVLERLLKRLEPAAVHFSVFGIREGLVYSLLSERGAPQGSAHLLLRRIRAPALPVRRARRRAQRLDRRPVRAAGPQGDGGGAAPAPRRVPALRHQLAGPPGLPRRAEPDPDRPCRARAASTTRGACSWRSPTTSATWAPAAIPRATDRTSCRSA